MPALPTSPHPMLLIATALLTACVQPPAGPPGTAGLDKIEHVVVIYAENRSFDHLYGLFPGADGIAQATAEQKTQIDHDGRPLPTLPPVYEQGKASDHSRGGCRTGRFASTLRPSPG